MASTSLDRSVQRMEPLSLTELTTYLRDGFSKEETDIVFHRLIEGLIGGDLYGPNIVDLCDVMFSLIRVISTSEAKQIALVGAAILLSDSLKIVEGIIFILTRSIITLSIRPYNDVDLQELKDAIDPKTSLAKTFAEFERKNTAARMEIELGIFTEGRSLRSCQPLKERYDQNFYHFRDLLNLPRDYEFSNEIVRNQARLFLSEFFIAKNQDILRDNLKKVATIVEKVQYTPGEAIYFVNQLLLEIGESIQHRTTFLIAYCFMRYLPYNNIPRDPMEMFLDQIDCILHAHIGKVQKLLLGVLIKVWLENKDVRFRIYSIVSSVAQSSPSYEILTNVMNFFDQLVENCAKMEEEIFEPPDSFLIEVIQHSDGLAVLELVCTMLFKEAKALNRPVRGLKIDLKKFVKEQYNAEFKQSKITKIFKVEYPNAYKYIFDRL